MSEQPLSVWGNDVYSSFGTPPITAPNINQNITFGDTNVNIEHVEDYKDIITKMQKDNKFEDLVKAIAINPLTKGSSLAKNNIHWN